MTRRRPGGNWTALLAVSRAEPAGIEQNIKSVQRYIDHEEWFLRGEALCVASLVEDPKLFQAEQSRLWENLEKELHLFPRRAVLSMLRKYQTNPNIRRGQARHHCRPDDDHEEDGTFRAISAA